MKTEFQGLVNPNTFGFLDIVLDGVNIVSAPLVFACKVDKDGNVVKTKSRLVTRSTEEDRFNEDIRTSPSSIKR